jgi:hypothetical protein
LYQSTLQTPGPVRVLDRGEEIPVINMQTDRVLSGWVGLAAPTADGLRLMELLLPGEPLSIVAETKRCSAIALTPARTVPTEDHPSAIPDFILRHCVRLTQFSALPRVADFLLELAERLHCSDGAFQSRFLSRSWEKFLV